MALNQEYFDAIHIDVVKKKYYNANKVEAVLQDIKAQVLALNAENALLRQQLEQLSSQKNEIGDALLSAKTIAQQMIAEAKAQAEKLLSEAEAEKSTMLSEAEEQKEAMLSEAEEQRAALIEEAMQQQEYAIQRVESSYSRMKEQHMACIEALNAEWQDFLSGLFLEEEQAPADLSDKVGAIAKELFTIDEEEVEE